MSGEDIEEIIKIFIDFANDKKYDVRRSSGRGYVRLDISNLKESTIINIFPSRNVTIQGKTNALQREFLELNARISSYPASHGKKPLRACSTKYTIVSNETVKKLKKFLSETQNEYIKIVENPEDNRVFR